MTDGGILYRWREDQRKYAPASVMHALVREESGIARDWWEPVCTLAEYLGVELAVDLEKQRRLRELNEAAEAARQADGPNPFGGERDTPGSWLPNLPRPNELVPREKSETQTIRYQFEALHRRIRAAAWRFFDNFQA